MDLIVQCYSLIFSFIFGLFFILLVRKFYKYLFVYNIKKKILFNLIFFLFLSTFYFYVLKLINNGDLHFYFLIVIIIGIFVGDLIFKYKNR